MWAAQRGGLCSSAVGVCAARCLSYLCTTCKLCWMMKVAPLFSGISQLCKKALWRSCILSSSYVKVPSVTTGPILVSFFRIMGCSFQYLRSFWTFNHHFWLSHLIEWVCDRLCLCVCDISGLDWDILHSIGHCWSLVVLYVKLGIFSWCTHCYGRGASSGVNCNVVTICALSLYQAL